ncbi:hypothetical protein P3T36_004700 [Kitasatospora sp. MAP12-15]|uniref:hypothetical protein n=1 Tax=unclassified Kitasatospora TaxID=2633591 RepID=UPI00247366DD|nr:hypothetical protein [Kitasatospora sp. MAP12-44]MDH6111546.1 hypothetical protein [Kitasatospora sp. MAP12-44]
MAATEQLVTIAAVLVGALTTHLTNHAMERTRKQHELLTRWDDKKLHAYEGYIDRIRAGVFLAVQLYEHKEGIHASPKGEHELIAELSEASWERGRAFERIMLLGGDDVVEAAHSLNATALEVDWQANGKTHGTLDEWRNRNRAVFRAINEFHDAARQDLGVQGNVTGESHPERDLLLPPPRGTEQGTQP